jgi:hypothetical protein
MLRPLLSLLTGILLVASVSHGAAQAQGTKEDTVKTDQPAADVEGAVRAFMAERDFEKMRLLPKQWQQTLPEAARKNLVVLLLQKLSSSGDLALENYADMFVPSRVEAGKMTFAGHGLLIDQDVFLENGRAAWAIEQLLGCNLPPFILSTPKDAKKHEKQIQDSYKIVIQTMDLPRKP